MKVLLLQPMDGEEPVFRPKLNDELLVKDLELHTLFKAMALNDSYIYKVVKQIILSLNQSIEITQYRQEVLKDCLLNSDVIREIYYLPIRAIKQKQNNWMAIYSHNPSGILSEARHLVEMFVDLLKELRKITDIHKDKFNSYGFRRFFAMIQEELSDEYFKQVDKTLRELRFQKGVLISADLGKGNEGSNYLLRKEIPETGPWIKRVLDFKSNSFSYTLDPHDNFGAQVLSQLRDQVITQISDTVAQSANHINDFFKHLQYELGFYIGCINLYEQLMKIKEPLSFPELKPTKEFHQNFTGLYDIGLALTIKNNIVGNDLNLFEKSLIIITGANQGGKSTFLRSIGVAQLLMQAGMFVPATFYSGSICDKIFTHYKREEDPSMKRGKLDEELYRMNKIIDELTPYSLILFNESFASTNEREGSELAKQIINALLEKKVKIFFVTHLFTLAFYYFDSQNNNTLFLRAVRLTDGSRTFKLIEGEPLRTSFGKDLYASIFKSKQNF